MTKKYICQNYMNGDVCEFESDCGDEEDVINQAIEHLDNVTHSVNEIPYIDEPERRAHISDTLVDC